MAKKTAKKPVVKNQSKKLRSNSLTLLGAFVCLLGVSYYQ
jgi:hypothetical protein